MSTRPRRTAARPCRT
ncbi:hypothetical protein, partial [Pseudomonas aeruginosa]